MPWSITQSGADTRYDYTQPWSSMFTGQSADVFRQDPRQRQLVMQAAQTGQLGFPDEIIRESMTAGPPVDFGPARPQPTIESVLDGSALQPTNLYDRPMNDFSGTPAGMEASSRNSFQV